MKQFQTVRTMQAIPVKMISQQESSLFAKAQSLGEGHLKQLSWHYRISTNSQNLPGMTF